MRRHLFLFTMCMIITGSILVIGGNRPTFAAPVGTHFIVNSPLDPGDGVCDAAECTLREAIVLTNATPGSDLITFDFDVWPQMITLNQPLPTITDDVTFDGTNPQGGDPNSRITISGGGQFRVLDVASEALVRVRLLVIANGAAHRETATLPPEQGGGIRNAGTLYIDDTILQDNHADEGGGIYNTGILVIKNHSTFVRNAANDGADGGNGGAVYNAHKVTFTNANIGGLVKQDGNTAKDYGGGLYNAPGSFAQIFKGTTFSYNLAWHGGGVGNASQAEIAIDSSFFQNNGGIFGSGQESGGGIWNQTGGVMTIEHSQFFTNVAYYRGGAIDNAGTLTLADTDFQRDAVLDMGGAIYNTGTTSITDSTFDNHDSWNWGGAIANLGYMNIQSSLFSGSYSWDGSAILNWGNLGITESTFLENYSDFSGAISNGGILTITDSTFHNNSGGYGAAILNQYQAGHVEIFSSTFSNNQAYDSGGAIANWDPAKLWVSNSTFTGNSAPGHSSHQGEGGAIYNGSYASIVNSTISQNSADIGGGIFNEEWAHHYGFTRLAGTIVANNQADIQGGDCDGQIASMDYNLDSDGSCALDGTGDLTADPLLGPLQDNGGPTKTQALLPGSPAIDIGPTAVCFVTIDQRGLPRPADGDGDGLSACDIGAFEVTP